MSKFNFIFLDKSSFQDRHVQLFKILYDNMSRIVPTGNDYQTDFELWNDAVSAGLKSEKRQVILIHNDHDLIGYFQYYINEGLLMMEEVQILSSFHGKDQVFRKLFKFLLGQLSDSLETVEAYSNLSNKKSQEILKHLGLGEVGMNKNAFSLHFRGKFSDLLAWSEQ